MERLQGAVETKAAQLLPEKLDRTLPAERAHGFVVAPFKMCLELFIQFFYAAKMLPIVKIPLVVAVTALHLAIVPRRSRRNQNMFDTPFLQQLIHRIFSVSLTNL